MSAVSVNVGRAMLRMDIEFRVGNSILAHWARSSRDGFSGTPRLPFGEPQYRLIETIRPFIEVHWGV